MSKQNPPKKAAPAVAERKSTPNISTGTAKPKNSIFNNQVPLLFGKSEFTWILAGVGLEVLGMLCMLGGSMPNPDTWDPNIIYSPMRITVAPILIVAGLVVVTIGIFKRPKSENPAA